MHAEHQVEHPVEGVPLYRLINTCRQGRYRIEKTIFAHPHQDAVLQITRFTPLKGELDDYHLYALLAPHLGNRGAGNSAWLGEHRGVPMLFARRGRQALALACSAPWLKGSAGYVGASDGWQDLSRHKRLTWAYERAEDGNVALTGEVDLGACGGVFALAVGFGPDAGRGRPSGPGQPDGRSRRPPSRNTSAAGRTGRRRCTLRSRPAARAGATSIGSARPSCRPTTPRASRAGSSPASRPPGAIRGATRRRTRGTGGYHLVWPRDLVESAGGLLAAGREARGDPRAPLPAGDPDGRRPLAPEHVGQQRPVLDGNPARRDRLPDPAPRPAPSRRGAPTQGPRPVLADGPARPPATSSGAARRPSRTAGRTSRATRRSPWRP